MTMNKALCALTLAAVLGASLSTAAVAGRGDDRGPGPMQTLNFDAMDADKDDKVTKAESDAFHAARTKAADTNADGKLSAEELAAMQIKEMMARATDRAAKMIEKLDTDGDKMLSDTEFAAAPGRAEMFKKIDADGDGAITKVEADDAIERMKHRGHGRGGKHGRDDHGDDHGGDQDGSNN